MKFTSALLTFVGLTITLTTAMPNVFQSRSELPYPVSAVTYEGDVNGTHVNVTGTIEEINAHLKTMFPDVNFEALPAAHTNSLQERATSDQLNKIQPPTCCPVPGHDWSFCNANRILDGTDYLRRLGGRIGINPTSCGRISCSWSSAIYFCNDNDFYIEPSTVYLASYADDIVKTCTFYDIMGNGYVCGQESDTDRYSIIVREDTC